MRFCIKGLCRATRTCPHLIHFKYNNVLTSKKPKPSSGIQFPAGIDWFRFLKFSTHKWKFWNVNKFQDQLDIDLEVVRGQSIRFWKVWMLYFSEIVLITVSDSLNHLSDLQDQNLTKSWFLTIFGSTLWPSIA